MDTEELFVHLVVALVYVVLAAAPFIALWLGWRWLSGTLLFEERTRCFLALLDLGLQEGRTAEQTVLSLGATGGVAELGEKFPLLARAIRQGKRLSDALDEVPDFLPPRVCAMLRVGEELGDVRKVLPAAEAVPAAATGTTRTLTNNLVVLLFVSPVGPLLLAFLAIWIFPKLNMIAQEMLPDGSAWSPLLFETSLIVAWIIASLWMVLASGSWLGRLLRRAGSTLPDHFDYLLPWRRKRMQRDFSTMFALLLDAGLPEARALDLAAGCAANARFRAQATRALRELEQGATLTEAISTFGQADEFGWRLRNAAVPDRGFVAALAGWHDALAAKAFQQQQAVSQLITTGFVLLNGVMVGLVALGLFELLLAVFEEAAL